MHDQSMNHITLIKADMYTESLIVQETNEKEE